MGVIKEYCSVYWNNSVLPFETILEGGKCEWIKNEEIRKKYLFHLRGVSAGSVGLKYMQNHTIQNQITL